MFVNFTLKKELILFFIFLPLLLLGQENQFLKFSKIIIDLDGNSKIKVNSIAILNDEKEYSEIINSQSNGESMLTGYYKSIKIDFFEKATKIKTDTGINYVLHFSIQKGETFNLTASMFYLKDGAKLFLKDSTGTVLVYESGTEYKKVFDKVVIGDHYKTENEFFLILNAENEKIAENCKLVFSEYSVYVRAIKSL